MASSANNAAFDRVFDTVSLVFTYTVPPGVVLEVNPMEIEEIEKTLGGRGELTQGLTENGPTTRLSLPMHQFELMLSPARLEVRSHHQTFSDDVATRVDVLLGQAANAIKSAHWNSIGYNFVATLESSRPAGAHIGKTLFKNGLLRGMGANIVGGTATITMDVEGSRLLLSIEPVRRSLTTNRFTINANFSESIESDNVPSVENSIDVLRNYCVTFDQVLHGLKII